MKNLSILTFIILLSQTHAGFADDVSMCEVLGLEKTEALIAHDNWAGTIVYDDKHDGTVSPGEMLVNTDLQEINNHYNYLLSVYGCYK
jgi:hypothetical protein